MADNYKAYGPGPADSATRDQDINNWQENYKTQTNRKVDFVEESRRILSGPLQGNWVSMWGTYTCTIGKTEVKIPYHITNGKIDMAITYYDNLSVYKALGYTLTPPADK